MQRSSSCAAVRRHHRFQLPPLDPVAVPSGEAFGESHGGGAAPVGKRAVRRRSTSAAEVPMTGVVGAFAAQEAMARSAAMASSPETTSVTWLRGKAVGAGSFGTVCRAFDLASMKIFAVKEVPLDCSAEQLERLRTELRINQELRHPNIVTYLGHSSTDMHVCIYLEYMPGGSMSSLLAHFGALGAVALQKAACGMLSGLDYLHSRSPPVVHRDLKGANLLVGSDMVVKLADFGCSKWCAETVSFTTIGSLPWMAPEVILSCHGSGRKADIWSFGCTIIEMATAEKPWGRHAFDNMLFGLNRIANSSETPPIPESASPACRDVITLCTQRAESRRPSAVELMMHEFHAPALACDQPAWSLPSSGPSPSSIEMSGSRSKESEPLVGA